MPMLSASCGRTRITTGVLPAPGGGAPLWPARRMPCRSLRSTRRAQNQYSSPGPGLGEMLEALAPISVCRARDRAGEWPNPRS